MTPDLAGRGIVVGVSGGIAAYKAADLVSRLVQAEARVRVVMTAHATQFVGPVTFQALSGEPVLTETFAAPEAYGMGHLSLAATAEALVLAPATANLLAKAAAGIADDLLSTTLLSVTCPILWAPAMNQAMWRHPATRRSVETLAAFGHHFVGPGAGWLACRQSGEGRLAEVSEIVAELRRLLWRDRDLAGRRVLVSAGPTREHLDPVRFLSNPSSGRQGYAIAEAARLRGAEVTLVAGPTHLLPPVGVELVPVVSAAEMAQAVLSRCAGADLVIAAAAVGDYAPVQTADRKLPKGEGLTLNLAPTEDIIAAVAARRRPGQVLVGFAAQTHDTLERAAAKLAAKGLDLIVANDVSEAGAGFGGEGNHVWMLDAGGGVEEVGPAGKDEIAHVVLGRAVRLLEAKPA
jgi:phosphopantothenoylcysteine decarboxylase/phosphopantothenate--cysteine ligase